MPGYGDRTDTVLAPVTGRPPDQVAYVVTDLEEGVRRLGPKLGVSRWLGWRYTASYLPQRVFRGQPGDFESHGVIAEFGPSLEIVAPLSGRSVFTESLTRTGLACITLATSCRRWTPSENGSSPRVLARCSTEAGTAWTVTAGSASSRRSTALLPISSSSSRRAAATRLTSRSASSDHPEV